MTNESGVLVIAELVDGKVTGLTAELLGLARRLADTLGGPVSAAVLGDGSTDAAATCVPQGADRVYMANHALLAEYQGDAWLPAVENIARAACPAVIVLGHTPNGADLAPRLAFRLKTAAVMDCVEAVADDDKLLLTRPCFGGNARAVVSCNTRPVVATIRAKSQDPLAPDTSRTGEIVSVSLELASSIVCTRIVGRERMSGEGVRLEDADVVVAGGRGLNGPEGFRVIEELAKVLGAAVGASRAACDLGWYPHARQIGLTGKVVTPSLYIAVGISGASQHMAGCAGAKTLVAINPDANAAIFQFARFGVTGDYAQIVPAIIEEIKKIKE
ncbi:MAG: electron transfer flavoprotein subunit alpha/FixB family protein [Candidatus Binatia bacterium]